MFDADLKLELNHKGGVIYFGIQKDGCIVGQEATDANIRRISQQITSRIKPTSVPCIEEIEINKKPVIKVTILPLNVICLK